MARSIKKKDDHAEILSSKLKSLEEALEARAWARKPAKLAKQQLVAVDPT